MIYYHSTNNKINKTIKKLIMKRAILSVLLLFAFLTGFAQNRNICRLGITYDISQSDLGEKQTGHNQCHPLFAGRTRRS